MVMTYLRQLGQSQGPANGSGNDPRPESIAQAKGPASAPDPRLAEPRGFSPSPNLCPPAGPAIRLMQGQNPLAAASEHDAPTAPRPNPSVTPSDPPAYRSSRIAQTSFTVKYVARHHWPSRNAAKSLKTRAGRTLYPAIARYGNRELP
jgi:hypothetical protein